MPLSRTAVLYIDSGTRQYTWVVRKRHIYQMNPPSEKMPSGLVRTAKAQIRLRGCASAQSDQGLHCPLTELLDTTECMDREQRPGWYFAHAQDAVSLRILHMFDGTFSLNAAHIWAGTWSNVPSICALRRTGSADVCSSYIWCVIREKGTYTHQENTPI